MADSDTFVRACAKLARALLAARRKRAAARLDNAFRCDITAFGFDATRVLEHLDVPHRHYVSHKHLPGRVVLVAASSWDTDVPGADAVRALLARGGTAILQGDTLPELTGEARVVRFEPPLYPDDIEARPGAQQVTPAGFAARLGLDPAGAPREPAFDEEALEAWTKKLCAVAEAVAVAL